MEAGTLVEWLVKPGDEVHRGDLIAVVETQKGQIDVEVYDSGTVTEILVPEGEEVPVGTTLAVIDGGTSEGPAADAAVEIPAKGPTTPTPEPTTPATLIERPTPASSGRVKASPAARRLAKDLGVDLDSLAGTGPDGAVTLLDVRRAAAAEPGTPPSEGFGRLAEMRRAIATAMSRSKREIPHYYLGHEIDLGATMAWLERMNTDRSVSERLVYAAVLLKAVALAVHEVPVMNGFWRNDEFDERHEVNLGVAISLRGGGLVAPAIRHADQKSVDEIMQGLRDLVQRARTGRLRSSEIADPTITVTNLGEQSVEQVFGVIYPPQVSLVGFGSVVKKPRVVGDGIFIRPTIAASLSADHRVSVGHQGARFLTVIDQLLQKPEKL